METAIGVLIAVGAYLLGSVSPSYLLVRYTTGEDVRQTRSRNAGTLNTYHRLGLRGALAVLFLDAGKGALAVVAPTLVNAPEWSVIVTSPLVLIGHNWPVFLKFQGGKGAAVLLGVSLGLFPLVTALCLIPIALVMLLLRNVVMGAAVGYVLVCLVLIFAGTEWQFITLSILLVVLVGVTYLLGFRREIGVMLQTRQWRNFFCCAFRWNNA